MMQKLIISINFEWTEIQSEELKELVSKVTQEGEVVDNMDSNLEMEIHNLSKKELEELSKIIKSEFDNFIVVLTTR